MENETINRHERHYKHPVTGTEVLLTNLREDEWIVSDTAGGQDYRPLSVIGGFFEYHKRIKEIKSLHDEPIEPTITLTQSQVVALFRNDCSWRQPNGRLVTSLVEHDAKAFCVLLGAPEAWAEVLVKTVCE